MTTALRLLVGAWPLASCAMLQSLPGDGQDRGLTAPSIEFEGATLAQAPTQRQLAAYFCPDVVSVPLGGASLLCQGFFGPRPTPAQMSVAFDLRFKVKNPNRVPLPLASILTAVTVFPAAGNQRLGATCVQLCAPGDSVCAGRASAGACEASSRDIRSLSDFENAAVGLLIAGGLAAAAGQAPSFVAPAVSAAAELDITARFSFGPEELLATLRQLATQSVGELKSGRELTFSIPYRLEGAVWFDGGSLGRLAVGYGPAEGVWTLPTQSLTGS